MGTDDEGVPLCAECLKAAEYTPDPEQGVAEGGTPSALRQTNTVGTVIKADPLDEAFADRAEQIARTEKKRRLETLAAESAQAMAAEAHRRFRAADAERGEARAAMVEALLVLTRTRAWTLPAACDSAGIPHALAMKLLQEHLRDLGAR